MSSQIQIFDRSLVRRHRDRAASQFEQHDILCRETGQMLLERVADVKRDFPTILDLGARNGWLSGQLSGRENSWVASADLSHSMLALDPAANAVVADEEWLPFADQKFDLVICNLALHWINDLPGALAQIKRILKPNGLFLAAFLGGQTLHELRVSLLEAELKISGGISPRLSPSIDMQTASTLMQRAGFSLPVTDQETLTFSYPHIFALMHDLRGMGETNGHIGRSRNLTRRRIFESAGHIYRQRFGTADDRIPATFEIIFIHGWA